MELVKGFLIVWVLVGMVLERESSVRLLDLGWWGMWRMGVDTASLL